MLADACEFNAASYVPIPTIVATCRSICRQNLTQYVLDSFSKKSPPYHVTEDDISTPLQHLEVDKDTGHQSVRGRGGVIAVMYEKHWTELSRPSWEREMDLWLSHHTILRYWAGTPNQQNA